MRLRQKRPTTCIYVQVKRHSDTYFILCDEYDPVESLKGRVLSVLEQTGFQLERAEEPLSIEDINLMLKKRVSNHFVFAVSNLAYSLASSL